MSATLVIGGTGKVGGKLLARFVSAGLPVRSGSRSGAGVDGGEGVRFDWFAPDGHDAALSGVDRVFMIAPVGASDPAAVMEPFVERALAAGVRRFGLLSSSMIEEGGPAMGAVHALLRLRAPEWSVVRPSWFMENFTVEPHLPSILFENAIYSATATGRVPFIAAQDIAETAFRLLTDDEPLNDGVVLTGPDLLTYEEVAAMIGNARGVPVQHRNLEVAELIARLEGFGLPGPFAAMLAGMDGAIASGAESRSTDEVVRLTGCEPTRFTDFVADRVDVWRPHPAG